jgi:hypothetical protein
MIGKTSGMGAIGVPDIGPHIRLASHCIGRRELKCTIPDQQEGSTHSFCTIM